MSKVPKKINRETSDTYHKLSVTTLRFFFQLIFFDIYFSIDITHKITAAQKILFFHKNRLFKKINLVVYEKYGVK